jgi:hypothetical protein
MKYDEFIKTVDQTSANFSWRYGQALMNVLHSVWPEKYNEITESEFDPYYTDKYVPYILNILKENWNPTEENLI